MEKSENTPKYKQKSGLRRKFIYRLLTERPEIVIRDLNIELEDHSFLPSNPSEFALWKDYYHPIVSKDISLYHPVIVEGESLSYLGRAMLARSRSQCLS